MHKITRRNALLGASAAVTGLTVAPLAIKSASVKEALAGDPVIGLAVQVKVAYRASIEADDAYEAAAHEAGYNICADFDWTTVTTTTGQRYTWGRESILEAAARVEEEGESRWDFQRRITPEERDRALTAIDARMQRAARARHRLGLDSVKERKDQSRAHWLDLEARMLDMPALTVAGVLAKMQSWFCDGEIEDMRSGGEPDQEIQTDFAASIYRDLVRLAGDARQ